MPRPNADERREQLVRAALTVMSAEGLERATARRIAEEAGRSPAALRYAFPDRQQLVVAVVGELATQTERSLRAAARAAPASSGLEGTVRAVLSVLWQQVVGDEGRHLLPYELAIHCRRTGGLEWLADWHHQRRVVVLLEVLQQVADAEHRPGDLDAAALARFVVAGADGLILQFAMHHDRATTQADLEVLVRSAMALAHHERPGPGPSHGGRPRG